MYDLYRQVCYQVHENAEGRGWPIRTFIKSKKKVKAVLGSDRWRANLYQHRSNWGRMPLLILTAVAFPSSEGIRVPIYCWVNSGSLWKMWLTGCLEPRTFRPTGETSNHSTTTLFYLTDWNSFQARLGWIGYTHLRVCIDHLEMVLFSTSNCWCAWFALAEIITKFWVARSFQTVTKYGYLQCIIKQWMPRPKSSSKFIIFMVYRVRLISYD